MPAIPESLSGEDLRNAVKKAVALLEEVIHDFPFDSEASKTNALAALFTPVLRDLIPGPVPMAIFDKPQQGTGASLLVDSISLIATGRPAYMTTPPEGREREEEWRKKATSILLEGRSIVTVDNIEGVLKSAVLGALLTCTYWQDRALGKNELISVLHRTTWFVTGNNVRLSGDMPRRCYTVRLDAKRARPWQRDSSKFKHPNLLEWVKEKRGELLVAIFILAKAWIAAGRPLPNNLPNLGSFEDWIKIIGGILAYAGIGGFLENLEEMYDKSEDDDGWEGFLAAWYEKWGEQRITTSEIKKELAENENLLNSLPGDLDHNDKGFTRRLGHALKARNGRHFLSGLYIEKSRTVQKIASWRVRSDESCKLTPGGTGIFGGFDDPEDEADGEYGHEVLKNGDDYGEGENAPY